MQCIDPLLTIDDFQSFVSQARDLPHSMMQVNEWQRVAAHDAINEPFLLSFCPNSRSLILRVNYQHAVLLELQKIADGDLFRFKLHGNPQPCDSYSGVIRSNTNVTPARQHYLRRW